jgi:hypothetical protein
MHVTFIASHSQKQDLSKYYRRIYNFLTSKGFDVFSGSLFEDGESTPINDPKIRKKWYENAIKNIKKSGIVFVEISYPSSANVGHEMTFALELGMPVAALYKKDRDPLFLRGMENERLIIMPYDDTDLEGVLDDAIDFAGEQQDTRFNFFISPKIGNYLDWVSKKKRVPRAVYLRRLIEEEMKKNKEYEE